MRIEKKRWLTILEAAEYLSVHRNTMYLWAKKGKIHASKISGTIRIDRNKLDEMLESPASISERMNIDDWA